MKVIDMNGPLVKDLRRDEYASGTPGEWHVEGENFGGFTIKDDGEYISIRLYPSYGGGEITDRIEALKTAIVWVDGHLSQFSGSEIAQRISGGIIEDRDITYEQVAKAKRNKA